MTYDAVTLWVLILAIVIAYMSWVFLIALKIKRLDVVDIAWGGAFIMAACSSLLLGVRGWLQYAVTALVVIWGLRLSFYILKRFRRSTKEDARYTNMRYGWRGSVALNAYARIFLPQAFLAFLISASVIAINFSSDTTVSLVAVIGIAVWVVGFLFEAVGDAQLRRHLADPENKGKLMTTGLWRYTRHPNYFGEVVQWWGIYIIALSVHCAWWTIVSPIIITILILFISGVPLTEKHFEGRRGWAAYKRTTSAFLPLPPRSADKEKLQRKGVV